LSDNWESIVALTVAILIAYAVVLWVGTIVWTYRDIRERTRDGWSQAVSVALVLVFNIPGLFLYLILRPRETLTEAYERRLEAEALMREMPERAVCTRCDRPVGEEFLLCPYCRTTLREPCLGCGRTLELSWSACPYCGANGPQASVTAGPPVAAPMAEPSSPPSTDDWPEPAAAPSAAPSGQPPR
jgi:hypothetical protein